MVKQTVLHTFTPASWNGIPQPGITQAMRWGSYGEMYRRQLWVSVVVNKRAGATARLPLPVYERGADGDRSKVPDHPYARLLARPHRTMHRGRLLRWTSSIRDIYGHAFWLKERDRGGRPMWLHPIHPTRMHLNPETGKWEYRPTYDRVIEVARRDMVHFLTFNPDSTETGMSPLEPLRETLENEAGARAANSAFWRNGMRPSVVLRHPATISSGAQDRLKGNWADIHGGASNFAKVALLEEGMEAQTLSLDAEEMQYVDTRKLNREEVVAAYDMPPPAVHILDRATFSNVTEQFRSVYRDTMAPILGDIEETLEHELRDGRLGQDGEPDFGDEVYAEFLMDEVLRGDFETRTPAMVQAINAGLLTPAEGRKMENRPYVEGSDRLFINAAVVPIEKAGETPPAPRPSDGAPPEEDPELDPDAADDERSIDPDVAAKAEADPIIRRHRQGIAKRLASIAAGEDPT
jgi:HK97 family phage portal protein